MLTYVNFLDIEFTDNKICFIQQNISWKCRPHRHDALDHTIVSTIQSRVFITHARELLIVYYRAPCRPKQTDAKMKIQMRFAQLILINVLTF